MPPHETSLEEHDLGFGLFAAPERFPWENWTLSYSRMRENVQLYENLGYDEYWVGEHSMGGFENVPSPEMFLANIAAVTDTITLAPGVVTTPYHDPFEVAERLTFLDQLTEGRIIYGLGGAGIPQDQWLFSPNSFDPDTYKPKMMEAIDIIQTYVTAEEPTSYDGEFWQYEDRLTQIPPTGTPEFGMAGLTSYNSYETCGKNGWTPLSSRLNPIKTVNNPNWPSLIEQSEALVNSAEEAGHDPKEARKKWHISRYVYVAENKEQALQEIRAGAEQNNSYLEDLGLKPLIQLDVDNPADIDFEWMIENMPAIIGSPEDCIRQIKALYERVGGFGTLLMLDMDAWITGDKFERSAELFAREVMPAFQSDKGPRDWVKEQINYSSPEPDEDPFSLSNSTDHLKGFTTDESDSPWGG